MTLARWSMWAFLLLMWGAVLYATRRCYAEGAWGPIALGVALSAWFAFGALEGRPWRNE